VALLTGEAGPEASALWVAATDGSRVRKVGTLLYSLSAVWDPSGRFVAYTGNTDLATTVLRIVEVATGAEREVPLPNEGKQEAWVADWSWDGRFLGIVSEETKWEYWVLQGLTDAGR